MNLPKRLLLKAAAFLALLVWLLWPSRPHTSISDARMRLCNVTPPTKLAFVSCWELCSPITNRLMSRSGMTCVSLSSAIGGNVTSLLELDSEIVIAFLELLLSDWFALLEDLSFDLDVVAATFFPSASLWRSRVFPYASCIDFQIIQTPQLLELKTQVKSLVDNENI